MFRSATNIWKLYVSILKTGNDNAKKQVTGIHLLYKEITQNILDVGFLHLCVENASIETLCVTLGCLSFYYCKIKSIDTKLLRLKMLRQQFQISLHPPPCSIRIWLSVLKPAVKRALLFIYLSNNYKEDFIAKINKFVSTICECVKYISSVSTIVYSDSLHGYVNSVCVVLDAKKSKESVR